MNKITTVFLTGLMLCYSLEAAEKILEPEEVTRSQITSLDNLIEVTEENLATQKILKKEIEAYQKLQTRYLESSEDRALLLQMVRSAKKILFLIKEHNLSHAFNQDFLSELSLFSQVANKRPVPNP